MRKNFYRYRFLFQFISFTHPAAGRKSGRRRGGWRRDSLEERHDFAGQFLSSPEALTEEHDLSDELAVGLGHRQRTEQFLEVIGKVGATGVTGVHGDKDGHVSRHFHLHISK